MSTEQNGSIQRFDGCTCEHDKNYHGTEACSGGLDLNRACPCEGHWSDVAVRHEDELLFG